MDFGRAHGQGIVDNLFREFLLSLVPIAKRESLHEMFEVMRHPRGSSKVHHFINRDGKFTKSGEQLQKKQLFRICFIGVSFVSFFDDGSEKSDECMKVHRQISAHLRILLLMLVVHSLFVHGDYILHSRRRQKKASARTLLNRSCNLTISSHVFIVKRPVPVKLVRIVEFGVSK
jgi:hypothetical protein